MDWEESTAGAFLAGENLPLQGQPATLVAIRTDMMDRRDGNGQEQVFIGSFADVPHEWIINKTNRRFLREQCGLTNANVSAFAPIPLLLMQNHTSMGIGILAHRAPAPPVPNVQGAPAPQGAMAGPPPATEDESVF